MAMLLLNLHNRVKPMGCYPNKSLDSKAGPPTAKPAAIPQSNVTESKPVRQRSKPQTARFDRPLNLIPRTLALQHLRDRNNKTPQQHDPKESNVAVGGGKETSTSTSIIYHIDGTRYCGSLQLNPLGTMEELMDLIFKRTFIPKDQQQLSWNGSSLPITGTLAAAGFTNGARILVTPKPLTIQLHLCDGLMMPMQVNACFTVPQLKAAIRAAHSEYESKNFCIMGLRPGETLGQKGIKDGMELKIQILESLSGTIYVKTLTGKSIAIDVDFNQQVKRVKEQIEDQEGIPPCQQRLIFKEQSLEDEHTLAHYSIEGDCYLHLVLKLRGC